MRAPVLAAVTVATTVAVAATVANATPIAAGSELSINGSDTFTNSSISFIGQGNVGGSSGSFAELPNCTGCVTLAASLTPTTGGVLYAVSEGGLTSTLTLNPPHAFIPDGTAALPSLTVQGSGVLTLSGFDPTSGVFEVTTQGPEGTGAVVTFSATAVPQGAPPAVPEPATWSLLGLGAVLAGFITRRGVVDVRALRRVLRAS